MLALYRAGRQAEALDSYRAARATLLDELGIEPSPRLQQLEQAILRQDDSLAAAAERTLTATALFLDLGIQGEVEAVAGRAFALATEELSATAERVERGLADAVLAVFTRRRRRGRGGAPRARAAQRGARRRGAARGSGSRPRRSRWASESKALPPCSLRGECAARSRARSSRASERLLRRARTRSGSEATATS